MQMQSNRFVHSLPFCTLASANPDPNHFESTCSAYVRSGGESKSTRMCEREALIASNAITVKYFVRIYVHIANSVRETRENVIKRSKFVM